MRRSFCCCGFMCDVLGQSRCEMGELGEKSSMKMVSLNRLGVISAPFRYSSSSCSVAALESSSPCFPCVSWLLDGASEKIECNKLHTVRKQPATCSPSIMHTYSTVGQLQPDKWPQHIAKRSCSQIWD